MKDDRIKVYFDTEFIAKPFHLELISIGMVREDGETYYAISSEFDPNNAKPWVKENVIALLEPEITPKTVAEIREEILMFLAHRTPEFWAYYASFDWVLFSWIMQDMNAMPAHYPKYCNDLRQEIARLKFPKNQVPRAHNKHNALDDALWNQQLHQLLIEFEKKER
jgi:hypothetical protein